MEDILNINNKIQPKILNRMKIETIKMENIELILICHIINCRID